MTLLPQQLQQTITAISTRSQRFQIDSLFAGESVEKLSTKENQMRGPSFCGAEAREKRGQPLKMISRPSLPVLTLALTDACF